jgi:hypothetical protein
MAFLQMINSKKEFKYRIPFLVLLIVAQINAYFITKITI